MRYRSHLPHEARLELASFRVDQEKLAILAAELGEDFKLVVRPGEEFDSPGPLNHAHLEPLDDEARAFAALVAEQDLEHARAYHAQWGPSENRAAPPVAEVPIEEREGYVPPPSPSTKKAKE